eukprot:9296279-Heterocapsa_arctica.AAC.1
MEFAPGWSLGDVGVDSPRFSGRRFGRPHQGGAAGWSRFAGRRRGGLPSVLLPEFPETTPGWSCKCDLCLSLSLSLAPPSACLCL